jgi:hypothetical protein
MVPVKYEAGVARYAEGSLVSTSSGQLQTYISVIICHCNHSFVSLQLGADVDVLVPDEQTMN